jgi:4-hydroxybenzoate polyprenyltransferase
MVAARTWAMLVNRLADARFDADNPRTRRRAFASGTLTVRDGIVMAAAAAGLFMVACAGFWFLDHNPWPTLLGPPVLAWIAFYSFTKRFTLLCHLVLGSALAFSPVAAAIAIDPGSLARTPAIFLLSGMVLCWVAGFDVIYALQDIDFDRAQRLRSIPAALGWRRAAWLSRGLHALALVSLIGVWQVEPRLGTVFAVAVALVAALLIYEHAILARRGRAGLAMAFFTINGVISVVLGVLGIADLVI